MTAHCPTLAKLAVNVLAMSVAASPCEGIWSIFDYMIKDKRRSWLKSENLRLQVFVHVNNELGWKRKGVWNSQTATWCEEEDDEREASSDQGNEQCGTTSFVNLTDSECRCGVVGANIF